MIRLATHLATAHLGPLSWSAVESGEVPLSGTDGQFLGLLSWLARNASDECALRLTFDGEALEGAPFPTRKVGDLSGAVREARSWSAEILLFNDRGHPATSRGLETCQALGQVAVVWAHNGPFGRARDMIAACDMARRVVCVSSRHADQLRDHSVFEKCQVIHNVLWWDQGLPEVDETERDGVVFLGATILEKGFHHLVRSWPEVRTKVPGASLTVIGSHRLYDRARPVGPWRLGSADFEREHVIPYWGAGREVAGQLGINLLGLLGRLEVARTLKRHRVAVVNPWVSRGGSAETFCVSAVEAQAAGCVVIGGRLLGLRETVKHGSTGILIRRERQLTRAIVRVLRDGDLAERMGTAGRIWSRQQFSAERLGPRWLSLFADVAKGKPVVPQALPWNRAQPGTVLKEILRISGRTSRSSLLTSLGM